MPQGAPRCAVVFRCAIGVPGPGRLSEQASLSSNEGISFFQRRMEGNHTV